MVLFSYEYKSYRVVGRCWFSHDSFFEQRRNVFKRWSRYIDSEDLALSLSFVSATAQHRGSKRSRSLQKAKALDLQSGSQELLPLSRPPRASRPILCVLGHDRNAATKAWLSAGVLFTILAMDGRHWQRPGRPFPSGIPATLSSSESHHHRLRTRSRRC
jgi:hypothetical protein